MATAWVLEQLGPAARTQRSAKAVPGGLVPTSSRLASLDQMLEPSSLVASRELPGRRLLAGTLR